MILNRYDGETPQGILASQGVTQQYAADLAEQVIALQEELRVTEEILKERDRLLREIPECSAHGQCVPHAIQWVKERKT